MKYVVVPGDWRSIYGTPGLGSGPSKRRVASDGWCVSRYCDYYPERKQTIALFGNKNPRYVVHVHEDASKQAYELDYIKAKFKEFGAKQHGRPNEQDFGSIVFFVPEDKEVFVKMFLQ